jgi:YaiO family outer membrane protein
MPRPRNFGFFCALFVGALIFSTATSGVSARDHSNLVGSDGLAAAMDFAYEGDYDEALSRIDQLATLSPGVYEIEFARAQVLSWAGDHTKAMVAGRSLEFQHPNSDDVKILVARIAYYQGDYARAKSMYLQVAQRQSDSFDAYVGLGDVYWAQQNEDAANAYFRLANHYDPMNLEVLTRLGRPSSQQENGPNWRIVLGMDYSSLSSAGTPTWRNQFIDAERSFSNGWALGAQVERRDRHDLEDIIPELQARYVSQRQSIYQLAVASVANPNFSEDLRVRGSLSIPISRSGNGKPRTRLEIQGRSSEYSTGSVETIMVGIAQYIETIQTLITPSVSLVRDESGSTDYGAALRLDHQVTDAVSAHMTFSDQPETETGITLRTRTAVAGMTFPLRGPVSLRFDLTYEDRSNAYVRKGLGVSLIGRF